MKHTHYLRLVAMMILSFVAMYALMYAMVDSVGNVYHNVNQFYMAGLMTAAMLVIELALMGGMYPNRKMNAVLAVAGMVAGLGFFALIRQQTAVSDGQFLRSMIPHHGGAILMCGRASIQDPTIRELCQAIISSQRREIDQMRALLRERQGAQ